MSAGMKRSVLCLRPVCASSLLLSGKPTVLRARWLTGVHSLIRQHSSQLSPFPCLHTQASRPTHSVQHRSFSSKTQGLQPLESHTSEKFSLIYSFPAIKVLRAVSRLKLLQTGITILLLPPVYYFYYHGQIAYSLVSYTTGIAAFAALMLYSLSHYLRRIIGMMYINESKTVLKVSHLTFWGRRHDLYIPVREVMTLGDTGDSRNETLLQLKRYNHPNVLYFTTRLGQVVDRQTFNEVFGGFP
ncbi:transmembrane protein 186 [Amia ocellicauda]|uniref:transmembrane protein 186 n=1 Tax=Amia ocellicauda TaxID=2972642 RepID=UPI0034645B91